jgi:hypothetical protein
MPVFDSAMAAFLELGHLQMEADQGRTFTWKNLEVPCVVSGIDTGLSIGVGPKGEDITGRLIVRLSNFLAVDTTLYTVDSDLITSDNDKPTPVAGKTLQLLGKTYRILSAKVDGARSFVTVDLTSPNK